MSKSKETAQIRRLSGIAVDTVSFCVHPDGKTAFIFDKQSGCFIGIDLNDGQARRYKMKVLKTLHGHRTWYQIRAIVRKSRTIILGLIIELQTEKYLLASFSLSGDTISAIHEHYLGIVESENSIENLTTDENDDIYVVSLSHLNESQTVFDLVKIDVDNSGNITSQFLFGQHSIHDYWIQPFVLSNAINFIDGHNGNNERLLTVPFLSRNAVEIKYTNDNDSWPYKERGSMWVPPIAINNRIFYYLCNAKRKKGFLVYCDWNNKCWKEVDIDMKDHVIIDWGHLDHSVYDGLLYLRGQCSLESCTEKFHIYVFETNSEFKTESHDAAKQPIANQGYARSDVQEAIEISDSSVSSTIPELNQPWNPKSKTLSSPDQEDQIQDVKDNVIKEQAAYQSAAENHPNSQWIPIKFRKEEELGSGQFGVVYKCWDQERMRYFVAKYTILQSDQNMVVAENEVKRLKGLSHHRIIEYYGWKLEDKTMAIFMEYMPLGSIRQLIEKHGAIGEKTAIIYIGQILEGLAYIHDKGVVHSDLKCDNLLSDANGNVKIGDFGLAVQRLLKADKSYINPNSLGKGGGTIFWTAPEFFETQTVNRKSDMWSLGCTIVEMLTTNPPYFHMTQYQFIRSQLQLTYDVKELVSANISAPMKSFLTALLQIDVSKRLKTGQEGMEKFKELRFL